MDNPTLGADAVRAALDPFARVPFRLRVRAGRGLASVQEILALQTGSLVALKSAPAEPVELICGDVIVARGEIVSVHGSLAFRVTEVTG